MKRFILLLVSVILIFSLSGCEVALETYPFANGELVRVLLKNGDEETTVYLSNGSTSQTVDIPAKKDATFVGYYDSEVGGSCYIDASGKIHTYYLDEFPRKLYARFTAAGNKVDVITVDSVKLDSTENFAFLKNEDLTSKTYSAINVYYSFILNESQSFWADYDFCLVDGSKNELCEKITLKENDTTSNVFNTGYMGCIQITEKIDGNLGFKFERLENTNWDDNIFDFVIVIEYIA